MSKAPFLLNMQKTKVAVKHRIIDIQARWRFLLGHITWVHIQARCEDDLLKLSAVICKTSLDNGFVTSKLPAICVTKFMMLESQINTTLNDSRLFSSNL